ncbi:MAG: STAS domain-containing protein [Bdellovibrionota bacterium]
MQARMIRENNVIVVHLSGRVDVETAVPFRDACLNRLAGQKVVFDFKALSFVGSSGILPFLETMQAFNIANPGNTKFSGVGSEFRKVFAATPLSVIEIHETATGAVHAFVNPQPQIQPQVVGASMAVQPAPIEETEAEKPTEPQAYIAFRSEPEEPAAPSSDEDESFA